MNDEAIDKLAEAIANHMERRLERLSDRFGWSDGTSGDAAVAGPKSIDAAIQELEASFASDPKFTAEVEGQNIEISEIREAVQQILAILQQRGAE